MTAGLKFDILHFFSAAQCKSQIALILLKKILNTEKKDTSCNRLIEGKKNVLFNAVLKSLNSVCVN